MATARVIVGVPATPHVDSRSPSNQHPTPASSPIINLGNKNSPFNTATADANPSQTKIETARAQPDFRIMINHAIDNASHLKNFKHMGNRKLVSIQSASFGEFLEKVSLLVQSVREWQIENIVSR